MNKLKKFLVACPVRLQLWLSKSKKFRLVSHRKLLQKSNKKALREGEFFGWKQIEIIGSCGAGKCRSD
jgi:hypothetical protein